jgi:dUTP pyrophosphatase
MVDREVQIQPNSIELTLRNVSRFVESGQMAFDNTDRKIPMVQEIQFDESGFVSLRQGCYKTGFNEILSLPLNLVAIARCRSSLLRSGVHVETAVWDSGFRGETECLMIVSNPFGFRVRRNARLIQLIFSKLTVPVSRGYEGIYREK